jgi:hypothetical protein
MLKAIFSGEVAEWASAALVVVCAATAGHYAAQGMNAVQATGAATSILGSIAVAVAVRVWPAREPEEDSASDWD